MSAVSHNKTLPMADFTGTVTVFNSQASTTTIAASDIWKPSNVNSAHDQFVTLSGNTSGQSTSPAVSNVILAGGSNITLSMATAAGVASITMYASGNIMSRFTDYGIPGAFTTDQYTNSAYFRILSIGQPVSFTRVDFLLSLAITSSATNAT